MNLLLQPVRVATGSDDTEGQLVFAAGYLVAVLVRLSGYHQDEAGMWFLEASFGSAEALRQPTFADLDEAQDWIVKRLARTSVCS